MQMQHPEQNTQELLTVPRPDGLPILGVLPQVWKDTLGFFLRSGTAHPDVVRLDFGPARLYLVSSPEGVKHILQDNHRNYNKGYDRAKPLLGEGLVTAEGEKWRRQRRLMQPAFHRQRLAELLPTMTHATSEMLNHWKTKRGADEPMDIAKEIMLLTQTIILRTMFSSDIGRNPEEIAEAFGTALEYLNLAIVAPFPILQSLPTRANRRFRRAMRVIDKAVYGIISERRESGEKRNDLLQMLLDARDEDSGEGMSDQQLHDEVLTIFLAGHETTASLLGWTFYLVGQDAQVEERLRAEISTVLDGREPVMEDFGKMPYTMQTLHEVLRLYPPAWMFARQPIEDDVINGYRIPAGATVTLSPYVTHRLPHVWDQPDRFDPDRFAPERESERPRYAFFPFGGGPRMCIGNNFALMEAPALLAMIMHSYQLKLAPGYTIKAQPSATLRPRPGVYMNIQPII
jgi:cytochrome P450